MIKDQLLNTSIHYCRELVRGGGGGGVEKGENKRSEKVWGKYDEAYTLYMNLWTWNCLNTMRQLNDYSCDQLSICLLMKEKKIYFIESVSKKHMSYNT